MKKKNNIDQFFFKRRFQIYLNEKFKTQIISRRVIKIIRIFRCYQNKIFFLKFSRTWKKGHLTIKIRTYFITLLHSFTHFFHTQYNRYQLAELRKCWLRKKVSIQFLEWKLKYQGRQQRPQLGLRYQFSAIRIRWLNYHDIPWVENNILKFIKNAFIIYVIVYKSI